MFWDEHKTKNNGVLRCDYVEDITAEELGSNYVIYKLYFANGAFYIGKATKGVRSRMQNHLSHAVRGNTNKDFAILKNKGFTCRVIQICETPKDLNVAEKAYIRAAILKRGNKCLNEIRF